MRNQTPHLPLDDSRLNPSRYAARAQRGAIRPHRGDLRRHLRALCALLLLVTCGTPAALPAEGGADSIEELAQRLQTARQNYDTRAWMLALHPDYRVVATIEQVVRASFAAATSDRSAAAEKSLNDLLARHGVAGLVDEIAALEGKGEGGPEGLRRYARRALADVDVIALAEGAGSILAEHSGPYDNKGWIDTPAALEDVEIDGDEAEATLDGSRVRLTRLAGRWYLNGAK